MPDVLSVATPIDELPITRTDTNLTASSNETSVLVTHIEEMKLDSSNASTTRSYTTIPIDEGSSGFSGYLEPDDVLTQHITVSTLPFGQFVKTAVFHKDVPLHLCCTSLKVCFGISTKFLDSAGRPKLNIVVEVPEKLCEVLEKCDDLALRMSLEAGSISQWRPLVKKNGYVNLPTVRLQYVFISTILVFLELDFTKMLHTELNSYITRAEQQTRIMELMLVEVLNCKPKQIQVNKHIMK